MIFFAGFAIDSYLVMQWFLGLSYLGNRPLLMLGTLMITVGVQVVIFGLLAEMITAATYRRSEVSELVRRVTRQADSQPASDM